MISIPIVSVGNSRGIRIPKKFLDAIGSPEMVQLDVKDGVLVIYPLASSRAGWDNPALWTDPNLTREDVEWLDAELVAEDEAA